jgi:hypothetical protein
MAKYLVKHRDNFTLLMFQHLSIHKCTSTFQMGKHTIRLITSSEMKEGIQAFDARSFRGADYDTVR